MSRCRCHVCLCLESDRYLRDALLMLITFHERQCCGHKISIEIGSRADNTSILLSHHPHCINILAKYDTKRGHIVHSFRPSHHHQTPTGQLKMEKWKLICDSETMKVEEIKKNQLTNSSISNNLMHCCASHYCRLYQKSVNRTVNRVIWQPKSCNYQTWGWERVHRP